MLESSNCEQKKNLEPALSLTPTQVSLRDAIYGRRAVRNFTPEILKETVIRELLEAAIQAPTAGDEEPWEFVMVQEEKLMTLLADSVAEQLARETYEIHLLGESSSIRHLATPESKAFYNSKTLILICAKPKGAFVAADCWLAAENLMLAAFAQGLGTCVIGCAVSTLNLPHWKSELQIPKESTVFVPIIVGVPAGKCAPVTRVSPKILYWN